MSCLRPLLEEFANHNATECFVQLEKPAILRTPEQSMTFDSIAPGDDDFNAIIAEVLPERQVRHYMEFDDGSDFIEENVLLVEEGLGRFLLTLQRQREQVALAIRRPKHEASILFDILKYAVDHGASDLHIREGKYVRLRVNAQLVDTDFMTDSAFFQKSFEQIIPRGKFEEYKKNGDLDFAWEEEGIGRFRVNLHCQRDNAAYTMRYIKGKAPTVKEVNLPDILKDICEAHNGIIFISGTTGSGKSTTMAAMLDHINNTQEKHVITIEDPIEYTFQDNRCFFEQREVGLDTISFDSALVHALRQDPDIVMVGEMRTRQTFETAFRAAETGHMVITTLHTKDASQSITRILDMFPLEERDTVRKNLSDVLKAIICQRLAPHASGKGVMPINEILINTPIVKKLIFENKLDKVHQAIEGGTKDGMLTFNQSLLEHYNRGEITEETALELSDNPQALKMALQGFVLSETGGIIQ